MKQLAREIDRIAAKKGPNDVARMKEPYRELLQKATGITQRARELCVTLTLLNATIDNRQTAWRHQLAAKPPEAAMNRQRS